MISSRIRMLRSTPSRCTTLLHRVRWQEECSPGGPPVRVGCVWGVVELHEGGLFIPRPTSWEAPLNWTDKTRRGYFWILTYRRLTQIKKTAEIAATLLERTIYELTKSNNISLQLHRTNWNTTILPSGYCLNLFHSSTIWLLQRYLIKSNARLPNFHMQSKP